MAADLVGPAASNRFRFGAGEHGLVLLTFNVQQCGPETAENNLD